MCLDTLLLIDWSQANSLFKCSHISYNDFSYVNPGSTYSKQINYKCNKVFVMGLIIYWLCSNITFLNEWSAAFSHREQVGSGWGWWKAWKAQPSHTRDPSTTPEIHVSLGSGNRSSLSGVGGTEVLWGTGIESQNLRPWSFLLWPWTTSQWLYIQMLSLHLTVFYCCSPKGQETKVCTYLA